MKFPFLFGLSSLGIRFEGANDGGSGGGSNDSEGGDGGSANDGGDGGTGANIDNLDDALAALNKTRKEAASYRTKHKDLESKVEKLNSYKEKFDKFSKVFGDNGDGEPDPEQIKSENQKLNQAINSQRLENTFLRVAMDPEVNADTELAWAYLNAKDAFKEIDPNDAKAGEKVKEIVSEAVKSNPKLANGPGGRDVGDDGQNNGGGSPSGEGNSEMNAFIRGRGRRK